MTNDDLWKDSVCAACGKPDCYGTCPEYIEFERNFLELMEQKELTREHEKEIEDHLNDILDTSGDRY